MINVNGRELDYDEAIRFIEEEKKNAIMEEQKTRTEKAMKENLIIASVTKRESDCESIVLCLADASKKYDFAMAAVEKVFGNRYYLDEGNAYKRYTMKMITNNPAEEIVNLAKKIYEEKHFPLGLSIHWTVNNKKIPVYVFNFLENNSFLQNPSELNGVACICQILQEVFG